MRKPVWTDEKIKAGFDIFLAEHQRLPRAHEIDALAYLPAARTIQKRFGGLAALRERLGYEDVHFGKGSHRSEIAHEVGQRGRLLETEVEQTLQEHFGAPSVHTEKVFNGKYRIDFYITTDAENFGVDVFFPATIRTMQSSINIKIRKYQFFTEPLYLVVANPLISQTQLDQYTKRRKEPFLETTSLLTYENFLDTIKHYETLLD